jgi:hypothetical protein
LGSGGRVPIQTPPVTRRAGCWSRTAMMSARRCSGRSCAGGPVPAGRCAARTPSLPRSASRCASSSTRPGTTSWAPTGTVSRPRRQSATGPPGSYPDWTHTGKRRRARKARSPHHEVTPCSVGRTRDPGEDLRLGVGWVLVGCQGRSEPTQRSLASSWPIAHRNATRQVRHAGQ